MGKETVLQLSKHSPSKLILAARSESKARDAIKDIKIANPDASVDFLPLDLSSFSSVKRAAETYTAANDSLDVLINNAGIMAQAPWLTEDGYEAQFGVNHMGHFLFTRLLLPTLQKTAKQPGADVRIINLTSTGHQAAPTGGFLPETVKTDMKEWLTWRRYGQSKLANILFTEELTRRFPEILSVAIHPGAVATNLANPLVERSMFARYLFAPFLSLITVSVQNGARNQLWAATAPRDTVKAGKYYEPVGKEKTPSYNKAKKDVAQTLWDWSEKEVQVNGY